MPIWQLVMLLHKLTTFQSICNFPESVDKKYFRIYWPLFGIFNQRILDHLKAAFVKDKGTYGH